MNRPIPRCGCFIVFIIFFTSAADLIVQADPDFPCQQPFYLFVLRFYGPVNPVGSCRARSVYLTTRLLGRPSPLSG